MEKKRRKYSSGEKVNILKLHLIDRKSVSDICDEYNLNPNMFYKWQKLFFDNGNSAFEKVIKKKSKIEKAKIEHEISMLKNKLIRKDEVIAEIMASHIELKKNLGEI